MWRGLLAFALSRKKLAQDFAALRMLDLSHGKTMMRSRILMQLISQA
jgi:hypothetical protein